MPNKSRGAVDIQRAYYTETADRYDSMHGYEASTDPGTANFLQGFIRMLQIRSVLDVGTATGLGMRRLKEALPDLFVCGVEPVSALIGNGIQQGAASAISFVQASGEGLPFPDGSFDAVCEFAVLHHAANPNAVVKEMLRVARKAVFICDSNRFGQGSWAARLLKLFLCKSNLWSVYTYLRTRGKGYLITEGDGLAYSYSIFDSYHLISQWADRVVMIPTGVGDKNPSWFHPLLTSGGVLVCALKGSS